jgi:hypothetical protein
MMKYDKKKMVQANQHVRHVTWTLRDKLVHSNLTKLHFRSWGHNNSIEKKIEENHKSIFFKSKSMWNDDIRKENKTKKDINPVTFQTDGSGHQTESTIHEKIMKHNS